MSKNHLSERYRNALKEFHKPENKKSWNDCKSENGLCQRYIDIHNGENLSDKVLALFAGVVNLYYNQTKLCYLIFTYLESKYENKELHEINVMNELTDEQICKMADIRGLRKNSAGEWVKVRKVTIEKEFPIND